MADDASRLLEEAEEQIEAWLCDLDAQWLQILADARAEAADIIALAEAQAADLLVAAERDAADIRTAAVERAVALDERVGADDLAALAQAVERLRVELSRVVEAAFDALPAVEATAAALRTNDIDLTGPAVIDLTKPRRRGLVRRLIRSGRG
jgi:hypothetical protein